MKQFRRAWDITEDIRKQFNRRGTGGCPLVFRDEFGREYEYLDVTDETETNTIVVNIQSKKGK